MQTAPPPAGTSTFKVNAALKALPEPLLYDRKSAAHMLGISLRAIAYLIAGGKIKTRRIGSRVLVPAAEIQGVARTDMPMSVVS